MNCGTVKWYSEGQGRGIIVPDGDGGDLGVRCSDIATEGFKVLYEGQRVTFDVVLSGRSAAAKNVVPCDET